MDDYQAGYQAGVADHGEHHRCGRCYAAGQADAEARVAALERDSEVGVAKWLAAEADYVRLDAHHQACVTQRDEARARVAALTGALASIAKNTCCDRCQEAALVAQAVLDAAGGA